MGGSNAILRTTMYLVITIYYVLVVHMNPLQLVLVGTLLEITYFAFQMPTGLFADVVSRRLSIILGWTICGAMFALEGLVPNVAVILGAQAVLGIGEAFIDGAEAAWAADEIGPQELGAVMLRASQVAQVTSIAGILIALALGSVRLSLPLVAGGVGMVGMGLFFAMAMPEDQFKPSRREASLRSSVAGTLAGGFRLVRGSTVLLCILGVELFYGGSSEGFDRLWEAHLIRDVHLPAISSLQPIAWFALLAVAQSAVGFVGNRWLVSRLERISANTPTMARLLAVTNLLYIAATIAFALAGSFVLACALLLVRSVIRTPGSVLQSLWFNRSITDSSVRATVLSMGGQCNALGQWIAGPLVGALGNATSLTAAVATTGLIQSPASLLFTVAARAEESGASTSSSAPVTEAVK
jgi:DHA3 family tetracycline resistance protein-like MFS transporter